MRGQEISITPLSDDRTCGQNGKHKHSRKPVLVASQTPLRQQAAYSYVCAKKERRDLATPPPKRVKQEILSPLEIRNEALGGKGLGRAAERGAR